MPDVPCVTMGPRPLRAILGQFKGRTRGMLKKSERLAALNLELRRSLPAPMGQHAALVSAEPELAVIHADSAAWRSRLRYQLPLIREVLARQLGIRSQRIHIGVQARTQRLARAPRRMEISEQAAAGISRAADAMDDPQLSATLRKLAARAAKPKR